MGIYIKSKDDKKIRGKQLSPSGCVIYLQDEEEEGKRT